MKCLFDLKTPMGCTCCGKSCEAHLINWMVVFLLHFHLPKDRTGSMRLVAMGARMRWKLKESTSIFFLSMGFSVECSLAYIILATQTLCAGGTRWKEMNMCVKALHLARCPLFFFFPSEIRHQLLKITQCSRCQIKMQRQLVQTWQTLAFYWTF